MHASDTRRVALVTGGARRIGAAIVRRLHADGLDVAIHCHASRDEAEALAADLNTTRVGSAHVLAGDLAQVDALPALVAGVVDAFGRLDALVNNAAAFAPAPMDAATPSHWDMQFATNVRAPFFLAQACAPHLRAAQGAIVNITDVYAERPRADLLAYAASKAALLSVTRGLAVALAPDVRVNAVAPGAILWPDPEPPQAVRDGLLAHTPLGRVGTPEDIADAVAWLLAAARYTTGEVLHVDGGRRFG